MPGTMPRPSASDVVHGSDRASVWLTVEDGEPSVDEDALGSDAPETHDTVDGGSSLDRGPADVSGDGSKTARPTASFRPSYGAASVSGYGAALGTPTDGSAPSETGTAEAEPDDDDDDMTWAQRPSVAAGST